MGGPVAAGAGSAGGAGGSPWTDFNVLNGDKISNLGLSITNVATGTVIFAVTNIVQYLYHRVITYLKGVTGNAYGTKNTTYAVGFVDASSVRIIFQNAMADIPALPNNPEIATSGGIVSSGANDTGTDARVTRAMQYYSLYTIYSVINKFILDGTGYQMGMQDDARFELGACPTDQLIPPDPYNCIFTFG